MREIQLKTGFEFLIVVHAYSHSFPATHIFIKYGAPLDSFLVSQSFIKPSPPRPPPLNGQNVYCNGNPKNGFEMLQWDCPQEEFLQKMSYLNGWFVLVLRNNSYVHSPRVEN